MNILRVNKQFDKIKKFEKQINYKYEPRIQKEDPNWRRHMFYKELKDEFIKEVSSYGFSPYIDQPYDLQKKDRNIMKFKKRNYNYGLTNYVRKKNYKQIRSVSADITKKIKAKNNTEKGTYLSKVLNHIKSGQDKKHKKKINPFESFLEQQNYDSSFSLSSKFEKGYQSSRTKSKTKSKQTSFFTSSRNISLSIGGKNKFIFRNSLMSQTDLKNFQKERLTYLRDKYIESIQKKSNIHPLVSFFEGEIINEENKVLNDFLSESQKNKKKRNIEIIKPKNSDSTNYVSRFEKSKSFIMGGKTDSNKKQKISSKYLDKEKNIIIEKKHNSKSAYLEKLEKEPKGIFKLAEFQRRRDQYYQKLLDEEDKICDKYIIK